MTFIQLCSSGAQHDADLPHEFSAAVEVSLVLVVGVVLQFEGLAGAAGHGLVRGAQLQRLHGLPGRVDGSSLPGAACRKYSMEMLIGIPWSHNQQFSSSMTHFKSFRRYSPIHCDIMATVSPLVFLHEGQLE